MQELTNKIATFMIDQGVGREEDRDIYVYGLDALLSDCINILIAILAGAVTHALPEALACTVTFLALRSSCGGYHASSRPRCTLLSAAFLFTSILCARFLPLVFAAPLLGATGIVTLPVIFRLAPVQHPNRVISATERASFRRRARFTSVACAVACAISLLLGAPTLAVSIACGMTMVVVSMVAQTIANAKQDARQPNNELLNI